MKETLTDEKMLLAYLKIHKRIDQIESMNLLRIQRLSARIFELRNAGHDIHTHRVPNKYKKGNHAVYELLKSNDVKLLK